MSTLLEEKTWLLSSKSIKWVRDNAQKRTVFVVNSLGPAWYPDVPLSTGHSAITHVLCSLCAINKALEEEEAGFSLKQ